MMRLKLVWWPLIFSMLVSLCIYFYFRQHCGGNLNLLNLMEEIDALRPLYYAHVGYIFACLVDYRRNSMMRFPT